MAAPRTARERARAELTAEIKNEARRQLATVGAHGLSLRAVARELGMVSSALYRYFPSRDHLLTALIIDAYDAMGEAAERADDPRTDPRQRWRAIWHGTRRWAREHPHEYALIYGSPVPGYQAPRDTVGSAGRVVAALLRVLHTAALRPAFPGPEPRTRLATQLHELAGTLESDLTPAQLARLITAWTQLFGMLSFELFGQFTGGIEPADDLFAHSTQQMADYVGLR